MHERMQALRVEPAAEQVGRHAVRVRIRDRVPERAGVGHERHVQRLGDRRVIAPPASAEQVPQDLAGRRRLGLDDVHLPEAARVRDVVADYRDRDRRTIEARATRPMRWRLLVSSTTNASASAKRRSPSRIPRSRCARLRRGTRTGPAAPSRSAPERLCRGPAARRERDRCRCRRRRG